MVDRPFSDLFNGNGGNGMSLDISKEGGVVNHDFLFKIDCFSKVRRC